MAAENYAFIVCSFLGFMMTLLPFPWHWSSEHHRDYFITFRLNFYKEFNTGICFYRAWIATACLIGFIDAILWNKTTVDRAPAWCAIGAYPHRLSFVMTHDDGKWPVSKQGAMWDHRVRRWSSFATSSPSCLPKRLICLKTWYVSHIKSNAFFL